METYNIALFGAFDHENFGDLLFPYIFEEQISKRIENARVERFSFLGGPQPFNQEIYIHEITEFSKKNKEMHFDLIAIGGGDLIRLDENVNDFYDIGIKTTISMWILPIIYGEIYDIPVVFNAPGVPFDFSLKQNSVIPAILSSVEYISVRDEKSRYKLLEGAGEKEVFVIPDTVLSLSNIYHKDKTKEQSQKVNEIFNIGNYEYVLVQFFNSPVIENYLEHLSCELLKIKHQYDCKIILMPIGYVHDDIIMMEKLYKEQKEDFQLIERKLEPFEIVALIANAKAFIGTSLHGSIVATSYNVPAFALAFDDRTKIPGFFELIKKENRVLVNGNKLFDIFLDTFEKEEIFFVKENLMKIEHHFDKIASVIKSSKKEEKETKLLELLANSLSEKNSLPEKKLRECQVNFDFGNGYIREFSKYQKVETYGFLSKFKIEKPDNVSEVKLQLLGGCLYQIEELTILGDDKKLKFNIPNSFYINGTYFTREINPIILIHPQIVKQEIAITMGIKAVTEEYLLKKYNEFLLLNQEMLMEKSELEKKQLKSELDKILSSKSWKLTKHLRKIVHYLKKW